MNSEFVIDCQEFSGSYVDVLIGLIQRYQLEYSADPKLIICSPKFYLKFANELEAKALGHSSPGSIQLMEIPGQIDITTANNSVVSIHPNKVFGEDLEVIFTVRHF